VEKNAKEEQLKDRIFSIYSEFKNEEASDRRFDVHFSQLCEQIYIWCRDFRFKGTIDIMGKEIAEVSNTIIKKDEFLLDKDGFFKYLSVSLGKKRNAYYRKFDEKKITTISKENKRKLSHVRDFIEMCEHEMGRELSFGEKIKCASDWFKSWDYISLIKLLNNRRSSSAKNEDGKLIDIIDNTEDPLIGEKIAIDPLDECISNADAKTICNAVEYVLEQKQDRSRDCYKAIFTLFCVKNIRDYSGLLESLNEEIVTSCTRNTVDLNQYEIYLNYHPKATPASAEASASKMLIDFKKDLEVYLRENNPEVFPVNH